MKIYFIGQKGVPANGGGVERHVEELATRLAAYGQDVFVFSRQKYTKFGGNIYKGVHILNTPAIYTKHLEAISHTFFSIISLIGNEVDIVHVHSIGPALLIPLIKVLKPRAKVVATIHSPDYFHQKWNGFARFMLRMGERVAATFADQVITVSQNLSQYLWHAYHCQATYIPNGVRLPELAVSAEPLATWGLQPQEYIVAISRLVRHKGLHHLIRAYENVKTDKKLVIVGGAEYTDDYVKELHAMSAGNPNVIFTGKQSGAALEALFAHAYVFVQPSESEGLSIALLEALSYNQALLVSDIPENMEVAKDLAVSFKQADAQDLAAKLADLLAHPETVAEYKKSGRDFVAQYHNWDTITRNTLDIYSKIVSLPEAVPASKFSKML